jgi:hypothetical protein
VEWLLTIPSNGGQHPWNAHPSPERQHKEHPYMEIPMDAGTLVDGSDPFTLARQRGNRN